MAKTFNTTKPWVLLSILASVFATRANAVVTPPPPTPDDGDAFDLYIGDQETYDGNLYRLPAGTIVATTVSPHAARADSFNTATLGGAGQWILGRQAIDLDLRVDENRFARNDSLNNTSGDGRLLWNWLLGSVASGQLGAEYNRGLASFQETLYLGRDIVDTTQYFANGRYQLGPRWSVYGGARSIDYTHSAPAVKYNDFRGNSGTGGIEYEAGIGDSLALDYGYTDGYYPQDYQFNNVLVNRDYREYTARVLANYALTDKTALSGYAGYLRRSYAEASLGHYDGDIWRITVDWHPTDKTELVAAGWHELHAYTVSEADYFVSHGVSLSPVWTYSEKLTLSAVASFEDQNFITSSTSVLLMGAHTDKITGEQINALYKPRDNLFINVFFRNEQRKSSEERLQYNDKLARLSVTFKFH